MKVLHVIEIEFEEEVDDNKIGGGVVLKKLRQLLIVIRKM